MLCHISRKQPPSILPASTREGAASMTSPGDLENATEQFNCFGGHSQSHNRGFTKKEHWLPVSAECRGPSRPSSVQTGLHDPHILYPHTPRCRQDGTCHPFRNSGPWGHCSPNSAGHLPSGASRYPQTTLLVEKDQQSLYKNPSSF